jgi:hypothetical protein
MKIRYGTHTFYKNIEMSIIEYYGHGLNQELEENHRILSYPASLGEVDGFKLYELPPPYENEFRKDIFLSELTNAFFVITKAKYRDDECLVWGYNKEKKITIFTLEESTGEKYDFIKLSDRYIKVVNLHELDKLWEEYSPSSLNLPMPEGLPKERVLEIPRG